MRRLARGQIVQVVATSDRYDSPVYTDVPVVDASATYDGETGRAALFVANRSLDDAATLSADLRGVGASGIVHVSTLHAVVGQDRHTTNLEVHDAVTPQAFSAYELVDGGLSATLPPLSWTIFEIEAAREQ